MGLDFSHNYFELFGLTPHYEIDSAALLSTFRHLQNQVHPDKFAHLSEAEKRVSMQWSTRVNEAYQTLKSPLNRAVYLLQLQGIDALAQTNTHLPMAFLMQQIEWREAIQDAQQARDIAALQSVEADVAGYSKQWHEQLLAQIDQQQDWLAATNTVRQLKFVTKIMSEIDDVYTVLEA